MTAKVGVDEILEKLQRETLGGIGGGRKAAKLSLLKLIEEALPKEYELSDKLTYHELQLALAHNSCLSQVRDILKECFR